MNRYVIKPNSEDESSFQSLQKAFKEAGIDLVLKNDARRTLVADLTEEQAASLREQGYRVARDLRSDLE